jgi:hypothetical protein
MNNVIRFRPANSHRRLASGGCGAQILFFTGVRYQRWTDEPQTQSARRKRVEIGGTARTRKSQR